MSTTNVIKNEHMLSVSNALLSFIYKMHVVALLFFSYHCYLFLHNSYKIILDRCSILKYCFNVRCAMTR